MESSSIKSNHNHEALIISPSVPAKHQGVPTYAKKLYQKKKETSQCKNKLVIVSSSFSYKEQVIEKNSILISLLLILSIVEMFRATINQQNTFTLGGQGQPNKSQRRVSPTESR